MTDVLDRVYNGASLIGVETRVEYDEFLSHHVSLLLSAMKSGSACECCGELVRR